MVKKAEQEWPVGKEKKMYDFVSKKPRMENISRCSDELCPKLLKD